MIREWRSVLLTAGVSVSIAAKTYRLLRAILNTAVREDEILRVNPCRVPGADREEPEERPVLSVAQVLELAALMPDRYRALVLVATFGCLRWGEVTALERRDLDVDAMTVRVRQQFNEVRGLGLVPRPAEVACWCSDGDASGGDRACDPPTSGPLRRRGGRCAGLHGAIGPTDLARQLQLARGLVACGRHGGRAGPAHP